MTGDFKITDKSDFGAVLDRLAVRMPLWGPVEHRGYTLFKRVKESSQFQADYISYKNMSSPRKFLYHATDLPLEFELNGESKPVEGQLEALMKASPGEPASAEQAIFGVHPCDLNAIGVLDRVFLGENPDKAYSFRRRNTTIIGLNCTTVGETCFCKSMGTGPHYKKDSGCDLVLTSLGERYLVQILSERGAGLMKDCPAEPAGDKEFDAQMDMEKELERRFEKFLDTDGLPELLYENWEHPVYERVADSRCLNCANCVMVCPTCFCYDLKDETAMDFKSVKRRRSWDACQQLHFADVHGGNFRSSRKARLRQFVTHKLGTWVEQFGTFGCVGCGRCMTWCPTKIDLALMAQEVQGVIKNA